MPDWARCACGLALTRFIAIMPLSRVHLVLVEDDDVDAEFVVRVLRQSGIGPAQAILVGDEIRDQHAAQEVHMAFGAVAWGYTRYEALLACAPALAFERVDELGEKLIGGCG